MPGPWAGRPLARGQVEQRLRQFSCCEVSRLTPTSALWRSPTGEYFSVGYEDCDGEMLGGIVRQLIDWAETRRRHAVR